MNKFLIMSLTTLIINSASAGFFSCCSGHRNGYTEISGKRSINEENITVKITSRASPKVDARLVTERYGEDHNESEGLDSSEAIGHNSDKIFVDKSEKIIEIIAKYHCKPKDSNNGESIRLQFSLKEVFAAENANSYPHRIIPLGNPFDESHIGGGSVHDVKRSYLKLKSNDTGAHYEFVYYRTT